MKKSGNGYMTRLRRTLPSLLKKLLLPAFLTVIFLLCAKFIPGTFTYEYCSSKETDTEVQSSQLQGDSGLYVLRACDDKISIFTSDGIHVKDLDIDISTLPEYDRRLLALGIIAAQDELSELFETLFS